MSTTDTERDERLREAREYAAWHRENDGLDLIVALDDEVTRLDDVVTAVRELHRSYDLLGMPSCRTCGRYYPCPTVRALDGGAA